MYIDTHSREDMEKSICKLFCMPPTELYKNIKLLEKSFSNDDYIDKLNMFIQDKAIVYPNEILLFHLSRRLHGTEDAREGKNLAELLLSDNPFCSFMKKYDIEFVKGDQHIDVKYKGDIVDWDKCKTGNPSYMKSRLGYFEDRKDFCFNGFAMKDLLLKNYYAMSLSDGPEFLERMAECLQCREIRSEYERNSAYFCYEYKLPIEMVIFDGYDNYTTRLKQLHLLRCVLERLYEYQTSNSGLMSDSDNPILRLKDDYDIPSKYYVGKEKITSEMLFGLRNNI